MGEKIKMTIRKTLNDYVARVPFVGNALTTEIDGKALTAAALGLVLAIAPAGVTADEKPVDNNPPTTETEISVGYGITMTHGPNGNICVNYNGPKKSNDLLVCGNANKKDSTERVIDPSKVNANLATDTLTINDRNQGLYDTLLRDGIEICLDQYTDMVLDLAQRGPKTFETRGTIGYSLEDGKFSAQYSLNDDGTLADHITDRNLLVDVQWEGDKITHFIINDVDGNGTYFQPFGKNICQTGQFPQYGSLIDGLEKVLDQQ